MYKDTLKDIIQLVDDTYYHKEMGKNSSIPEGFLTDYLKKVDVVSELKNINTEDINIYDFYRQIKLIFMKTRDYHFTVELYNFRIV